MHSRITTRWGPWGGAFGGAGRACAPALVAEEDRRKA
eukprot:COSAG06_NODE_62516_length_265_cov_0.204819_1_plen_36_part_01